MVRLTPPSLPSLADLKGGVIVASSGNHGLAIAYASGLFGTSATICVREDVNSQKLAATEAQGATAPRQGKGTTKRL